MPIFARHVRSRVLEALEDTRAVYVMGARQVGKSTLARDIASSDWAADSVSLDDQVTREAALSDPIGFLAALDRPVHIDEVQRAPDLLLAVEEAVDADPRPGRYLLTGSANAVTSRMETIPLWPLSQAEVHGSANNFVDALLADRPPQVTGAPVGRDAFAGVVAAGGYPEGRLRSGRRRDRWFASYVETTLGRDLRDLTDARRLDEVPRLLRQLAAQAANLLSFRKVAARLDINHETVREYVALLQTLFLVRTLPAWRPGLGAREVQTPKCHLVDSGLLAHLLGADEHRIARDDQVTGRLLENFVAMEVLKHAGWAGTDTVAYHYRRREDEVDIVLETRAGDIAAVEVKAAASLRAGDWRAIERLRDACGGAFKSGTVVYAGGRTIPLGDRLWAVPVSALWA